VAGPIRIAASPDGKSVYVTGGNRVAQYNVGPTGKLSPKSPASVATAANPLGIAVSPDGTNVYATFHDPSNGFGGVFQFDVGTNGRLSPKSPASVANSDLGSFGVAVGPSGNNVYVTNALNASVSQFSVGPGGKLSQKSPPSVAAGNTPLTVAVRPNGQSVYVTNLFSRSVSQYTVGPGGKLQPKSPPSVIVGQGSTDDPTDVVITPTGGNVYVANDSGFISQFTIGAGGKLVPKAPARVSAGPNPGSLAVSPNGQSVYLTEYGDNKISQYSVGAGGRLTPKSPAKVKVGFHPFDIAATP
jgi:DNA-binding beta-propeller fold protein YncE